MSSTRQTRSAIDELIEACERAALGNLGLVTWAEASAAGIPRSAVNRLIRECRWRRLAKGVFGVSTIDGGPLQQAAADLISAGPAGFLHRRSAALALGRLDLDRLVGRSSEIALPQGSNGRLGTRRSVPSRHIVEVNGLRTTDGLQTLLDLALILDDDRWEWALEAVLRARLVSVGAIEEALLAPGRKSREAVGRVRRVLDGRRIGAPPTDSVLETRFVQLCRRIGAPDPERQVRVETAGGVVCFVDLAWPDLGVFAELDGEHHLGQPRYDARRQTAIIAATGWLCARFTWTEVVRTPITSGRRLLAVLDQARQISRPGA